MSFGLLAEAGKIRKLMYAFVSLDTVPLEPLFGQARQNATIPEIHEWDEGMFQTGLKAAAERLPFLPMRAGPGSGADEHAHWCTWTTIQSIEASARAPPSVDSSHRVCAPPE